MSLDLLLPFGFLIGLTIYLIYSRDRFEKNIITIYENKLKEWKKHSSSDEKKVEKSKEFVALVFKKDYKFYIEYFDKSIEDSLKRAKFEIKEYGSKDE
ncbi:hypothetical protein CRU94_02715 [Arcobacter sp. AHV-9/2010]|uniref:hypothetical protein n=1 Tax=Arcobacter sp. AHV-9/2010 TaxID=2021861 RepID=UPI00100BAFF2|nr:hypothetical protein [Arcobacter sp. CECT 9299]RXJ97043.1 hypothetical protein CRU94_02715 [Arcobacter sp. CECT 9299]